MPATHHQAPTGWLLIAIIVLGLLYVAWRAGRLRNLRGAVGGIRLRGRRSPLPEGVRIRPITLLPMALLLIAVAVLVIAHGASAASAPHGRLTAGEYQRLRASQSATKRAVGGHHLSWSAARAACAILGDSTALLASSRADCLGQIDAQRAWIGLFTSAARCQKRSTTTGPTAIAAAATTAALRVVVCMDPAYRTLGRSTTRLYRADSQLRSAGIARGFTGKCLTTLTPTDEQLRRERSYVTVTQRLLNGLALYLRVLAGKAPHRAISGATVLSDAAALAPARQSWLQAEISYPWSDCPHA